MSLKNSTVVESDDDEINWEARQETFDLFSAKSRAKSAKIEGMKALGAKASDTEQECSHSDPITKAETIKLNSDDAEDKELLTGEETCLKKRKKKFEKMKEKKKQRKNDPSSVQPIDVGQDHTRQNSGAALFWSKYCSVKNDQLTSLEKNEGLPSECFLPSTTPPEPLPEFIKANLHEWKMKLASKKGKNKQFAKSASIKKQVSGSPRVLIICSGARRCVQLLKTVAVFRCPAAKLFAKHMKIQEQQKILKKCPPIAVGTPSRLLKLASLGALTFESTEIIIFDMGKDVKNFTVLDIHGVKEDLMNLFQAHIQTWLRKTPLTLKCALL
mmetsp:Transcript_17362/g.22880  ORF Transcript_17362/g.22880 Transcript_17362/m.22880 type:complete len:328 (-) Transcript_17362:318-1301(-)